MKKFTKDQMDQMRTQVEQIMVQLSAGKTAREICAQMYVDGLEDKTLVQGEAMADSIIDSIVGFDRDYERAKTDADSFTDSFLDEACKGKSLAERCTYLMKLIAAISAAKTMLDADTDEKREEAHNMVAEAEAAQVFEGEATDSLEMKLREQLKNILKGSNILITALEAQRDNLLEVENEDEAATLLVEAGTRNNDYRAILAMQAYINIKNGTFAEIPSDLTAAQVATMICTYSEEVNILHQLEEKRISEEVAHMLLAILGTVAIMRMTYSVINIGMALCATMFGWVLTIPAMLVVATTICTTAGSVMDNWIAASEKIVHYTAVGVKAVCNAASRVLNYAAGFAKPTLTWLYGKATAAVKRLLSVLRRGHRAENSAQQNALDPEDLESAVDDDLAEEEIESEEEYENE